MSGVWGGSRVDNRTYLAVYKPVNEQVEVRNLTGGLLGLIATDIPDNTERRDTLLWPDADTIVTETGRWSIATGESGGYGVSLGPGEATWNDGERYAAPNADVGSSS